MPNVGNPAATHDLLIGVTLNGSVFAWDAENQACNGTSPICWSRQGKQTGGLLWFDDCAPNAIGPVPLAAGLPFSGIVATPVIDTTLSPPAAGSDDADDLVNGAIQFKAVQQMQRPALLEAPAPIPGVQGVSPIIYLGFGVAAANESSPQNPYHGWLLGYGTTLPTSSTNYAPLVDFTSTARGCGTGGGTSQCSNFGSGTPPCDCEIVSTYNAPPNWGGHGGGIWMSGRGPAANTPSTLNDGYTHVFVGTGNGGFQDFQSTGPNNYGQSILDFRLSATVMDQTPYQSFTPWSAPLAPDIQTLSLCNNPSPPPSTVPCTYTFQYQNETDYDQATSGVLLYNDAGGTPRLVIIDKAGYGYVLTQGNLCGPKTAVSKCSLMNGGNSVQGFASGDNGNIFPFAAVIATEPPAGTPVTTFCTAPNSPDTCQRVNSLAFYNNTLYLWPFGEKLTALQSSNNTSQNGVGTISTSGTNYSTLNLASCTALSSTAPCFTDMIIPGDQIVVAGQPTQTVTLVISDTSLTVSPGFNSPGVNTPTWSYNGYFINPVLDIYPGDGGVGYPGGSLVVTSNGNTGGLVWGLVAANLATNTTRDVGSLFAYSTTPTANPITLKRLWTSPANAFCVSSFALPTVVHGMAYVPTYAIHPSGDATRDCPPTTDPNGYQSGILVYGIAQ